MDGHDTNAGAEHVAASTDEVDRRRRFMRIDDADLTKLAAMKECASVHSAAVVERFYEHLLAHEETRAFFQNEKHLQNVKRTQGEYFSRLFAGECDLAYFEDRIRVGKAHERIGLGPKLYIGGYCIYMNELLPIVFERYRDDPEQAIATFQSLVKLICFDISIAIDTYIAAMADRESRQVSAFVEALDQFSSDLTVATGGILSATASQAASAQQQATGVAEITTTLGELRQTSAQRLDGMTQSMKGLVETFSRPRDKSAEFRLG